MSTITVDVSELPARLGSLVELAKAGTEVIVVDAAGTRARLTPAPLEPPADAPRRTIVLGLHPGSIEMAPDFNDPLPDEFWDGAFS